MIVGIYSLEEEMKTQSTDEEKEPAKRSRIRAKLKISEARAQLQSVKTVTYHHTCKILNTYALLSSCDMIFVAPVLAITEATVVFCSTTFLKQICSRLPGTDVSLWSSLTTLLRQSVGFLRERRLPRCIRNIDLPRFSNPQQTLFTPLYTTQYTKNQIC